MAITSYSDLQTAIRQWGARTDTTTVTNVQIQEFIALTEDRLEIELPVRSGIDYETITGTASSRVLTPATEFVEPIGLWLTTYGTAHERLTPLGQGTFDYDLVAGVPTAWNVIGQTIELNRPCDTAHTFEFLRRVKLYDLATTDPNWLLTNYPGVYLAGCMTEFYSFIQDQEKEAKWEARFQYLVEGVRNREAASNSVGQMLVDPALTKRNDFGFNINSGYY